MFNYSFLYFVIIDQYGSLLTMSSSDVSQITGSASHNLGFLLLQEPFLVLVGYYQRPAAVKGNETRIQSSQTSQSISVHGKCRPMYQPY